MKKIAINMSGAVRTFEYCDSTIISHIITPLKDFFQVDLFGHFWIMNDMDASDISVTMKWKNDTQSSINKIKNFGFTNYIIKEYSKKYENKIIHKCHGEFIINDYINTIDKHNYAVNCMGMYYKILKCHQLMQKYETKNNFKYDYVIRIRPDFYWKEDIPISIISQLTNDNICLVKDSFCINANWNANDKFFMGTNDVMTNYSNIFNKIAYFHNKNILIEGQNVAKHMIEEMNLNVLYFGDENTYEKAAGKFVNRYIKRRKNKIFIKWFDMFDVDSIE